MSVTREDAIEFVLDVLDGFDQEESETDMPRTAKEVRAELTAIEAEEERLFNRKQELLGEVEWMERRPAEPDAKVVTFNVQFQPDEKVYMFAALRSTEGWHTTSSVFSGPMSWYELCSLVERDYSVKHASVQAVVRAYYADKKSVVLTW